MASPGDSQNVSTDLPPTPLSMQQMKAIVAGELADSKKLVELTKVSSATQLPHTTSQTKLIAEEIKSATKRLWGAISENWKIMYTALTKGTPTDRSKALDLCHFFAGAELTPHIDFEFTVGEINRVYFEKASHLVELYISPKLQEKNVHIMNYVVKQAPKLDNLQVVKYRAYNKSDALIEAIDYETFSAKYTDFGCQHFNGIGPHNNPLINIVIYVKKQIADKILKQREVTFVDDAGKSTKLMKWLPYEFNVVDLFLLNIIGEYNLIHRTGYIEFLPEGDPLIASGSVFTELADLKGVYDILEDQSCCNTCNRYSYTLSLMRCSRCHDTKYCCKTCQTIDYKVHKQFCG